MVANARITATGSESRLAGQSPSLNVVPETFNQACSKWRRITRCNIIRNNLPLEIHPDSLWVTLFVIVHPSRSLSLLLVHFVIKNLLPLSVILSLKLLCSFTPYHFHTFNVFCPLVFSPLTLATFSCIASPQLYIYINHKIIRFQHNMLSKIVLILISDRTLWAANVVYWSQ